MRVVSLCPSLTETVFALGRGDALVGRTRFCVLPRPAVDAVGVVGGTKDPEVDAIIARAPDVVLMNAEENRREDAEALEAAGVRIHASLPRRPSDVPPLLREWGALLDAADAGDSLARALEQDLSAPRSSTRTFAFLIWRKPWMAAGPDTYAGALLEAAGGRNICSGDGRYPEVDLEALAARAPQRLLLTSEPFRFRERHVEEVCAATGLGPESVRLVDGQALTWHGARTRAGLHEARRALS